MHTITLAGVSFPLWVPALVVLAVVAAIVTWRWRRRSALQRQLGSALEGVRDVQGSIHPDQERLP